MKKCSKCEKHKRLEEFNKVSKNKDGLNGKCKACIAEYDRNYYIKNKEKVSERQKEYYKLNRGRKLQSCKAYQRTERGKRLSYLSTLRMQKKYPEKHKARYDVRNALVEKRLKKEPCEVCGEEKVEAHHDDYSKSLEVRWLCPLHHRIEDGIQKYHRKENYA